MKRLLITLSLSLLAVTAVVLWRGWPHLFPSSEVSDLYRRYEHNDHQSSSRLPPTPPGARCYLILEHLKN